MTDLYPTLSVDCIPEIPVECTSLPRHVSTVGCQNSSAILQRGPATLVASGARVDGLMPRGFCE